MPVFRSKKPSYAKRAVTSRDGTTIGFRQMGQGPGVVVLHGGALASQHYMTLGTALAEEFTVYLPDRRGRGMSGPYGPRYCIAREDEDLAAVVAETGAHDVFGAADGGLFALHASLAVPAIRRVAAFEPVIFAGQPGVARFREVIARGEGLVARGEIAAAMASLARDARDSGDERAQSVSVAYRLLGTMLMQPAFCRLLLWLDAQLASGDDVALRELVPALIPELALVKATKGTIEQYENATADVLLMCGTGAPPLFTGTLDALGAVLPRVTRVDLPGLNHAAAQDRGGNPLAVANELRRFFGAGP